jgi:Secretion system C-terminal sorting domain
MIRFFSFTVLLCFCYSVRGQYGYFNIYFEQDPPNFGSASANVFLADSNYVTLGGIATYTGDQYVMRKVTSGGNVLNELVHAFPRQFNTGNPDTYIQAPSGEYFMLETISQSIGYTAAIAHWSEDFVYLYTDTLADTNEDTAAYNMRAICMVDDTSFVICGTQLFNDNPGEFPDVVDRSEKVLWKYHTNGQVIWKKVLFEEEETSFMSSFIFKLDNGDLLISTNEIAGEGEFSDHQLIKTNSSGEVIDTYEWGNPNQHEARAKGVLLSNEHVILFYVQMNATSEVILQDVELHFMEFDPEAMLPVTGTDTEVPNAFTDEWIAHFAPEDLIATPDGGYLALMNFDFIENGPYGDQPLLLKVDSALQLEWMRAYLPPVESIEGYLLDIENTSDGGYIATGWFTMAETLYQRHWVIKLDACGEVEDNGCPFVGVEEGEKALFEVQVFPNPTKDNLTIQSSGAISEIRIFDMSGKVLLKRQFKSYENEVSIETHDFSPGIYLMKIVKSDNTISTTYFARE